MVPVWFSVDFGVFSLVMGCILADLGEILVEKSLVNLGSLSILMGVVEVGWFPGVECGRRDRFGVGEDREQCSKRAWLLIYSIIGLIDVICIIVFICFVLF